MVKVKRNKLDIVLILLTVVCLGLLTFNRYSWNFGWHSEATEELSDIRAELSEEKENLKLELQDSKETVKAEMKAVKTEIKDTFKNLK